MSLRHSIASIAADPNILDSRNAHQLHGVNFDPPLPSPLAADARKVFRNLAIPDGTPFYFRKLGTNKAGTSICHGIFEIVYFEKCLANIGDRVGDYRVETNALVIGRGRGKARETLCARLYIVVQYRIKVKRDDPVQPRPECALELPKPEQDRGLVLKDYRERY